jgi:hypothetical protein
MTRKNNELEIEKELWVAEKENIIVEREKVEEDRDKWEQKYQSISQNLGTLRTDIITRSNYVMKCDNNLYTKIAKFVRTCMFPHVKFIVNDDMINNLSNPKSIPSRTMDHFNIDARDRIAWWRGCNHAVTDTISNYRNQVNQAIKAQVLSK